VHKPGITVKGGTVCRLIDFAPGHVSPLHRVKSIDYCVVIEGSFRMVLDSGEERTMHRGDVAVQRSTCHRWINVTGNGHLPGRVLFVLQDIQDLEIAGKKVDGDLGELGRDYVGLPGHGAGKYDNKFDSEL
jgi:hypothetical protein